MAEITNEGTRREQGYLQAAASFPRMLDELQTCASTSPKRTRIQPTLPPAVNGVAFGEQGGARGRRRASAAYVRRTLWLRRCGRDVVTDCNSRVCPHPRRALARIVARRRAIPSPDRNIVGVYT